MSAVEARWSAQRERVAALQAELSALHDASLATNADDEHDPEGSTIAYERAQLVALLAAARRTEQGLKIATDREAVGERGTCQSCGAPIGEARLDALPQANTCIACAQARR